MTLRRRADHWAYDAVRWWLPTARLLLPALSVLCLVLAVLLTALLWFQGGAGSSSRPGSGAGRGLVARRPRRPGDAGGPAHTERYRAVMGSGGWRRRRAAAIRRAGRRCQRCGARGPLDVHHLTYRRLGRERPGDLLAVCERCHGALHGRPAGGGG